MTVPTLMVMALSLRKTVYPSSWDAQQRAAELATVVEEATSGVRVVKGFGQEGRELDKLTESGIRLFGARMRNARISAKRQSVMQTVPALAQVAILAFGGWLAMDGQITLGTLLAFQTYLLQLVAPVRQVAGMLVVASTARAAAERIFELLDSTPDVVEKPDARAVDEVRGEVVFDDVSFGYLRSEPVLDHFSLRVAPGEVVALVGASGSGKSTVSLLLPRFYDAAVGRHHASTGWTCATSSCRRCAASWAWCSRRASCSPSRSGTTCATAGPTPATRRSCGRPAGPRPTASSRPCPRATTRWWASGA